MALCLLSVTALNKQSGQLAFDQRAEAESLIQVARQEQPGIRDHRRPSELDPELRIE